MSDRHVGGMPFTTATEWKPTPITTAAESYIRMALSASRPSGLDLARGFAEWCEKNPQHGYDPDVAYAEALEVGKRVRFEVISDD